MPMTPAQYAEAHGVPRQTVMNWLRAGKLAAKQSPNGRWQITQEDKPGDDGGAGGDEEAPRDLTVLKARKLEAEIHKLQQQVTQGRDSVIEEVYDELLSEAAWLLEPLKTALGKSGLNGAQRKTVGVALRQVAARLRQRSKTALRLSSPAS